MAINGWCKEFLGGIRAIDQLCMIKIAVSSPVFLLLGTLVPWSPGTQLPVVEMRGGKFFGNPKFGLGPDHRVTWYIGGISGLLVVEMSWGKI